MIQNILVFVLIALGQRLMFILGQYAGRHQVRKQLSDRALLWVKDRYSLSKEAYELLSNYTDFVVIGTLENRKLSTSKDILDGDAISKKHWWNFQNSAKSH